ncbi:hypothetical protein FNV43_RR22684 [Rhamnella rubrinervis]|uniref:Organ-specific protein S2 n=1 Tax=Rhamnella rubrinervis TaxID=2594499 RepID=A0A8K0DUS0_9ROSA|nr:hypothetical protein FNV43_RR22684 [Rhamnella rubrinervis]
MKPACALFALLSLLLLMMSTIESRKDPAEYWRSVMKEQPMPEAIHGLVHDSDSALVPKRQRSNEEKNTNCHEKEVNSFGDDFEPRPNVSKYHDDDTVKSFGDDFEPRPNVSQYHDDDTKSFVKNHENDNNVGPYKEAKSFAEEFEPRPNVSIYKD